MCYNGVGYKITNLYHTCVGYNIRIASHLITLYGRVDDRASIIVDTMDDLINGEE